MQFDSTLEVSTMYFKYIEDVHKVVVTLSYSTNTISASTMNYNSTTTKDRIFLKNLKVPEVHRRYFNC